jgi:hypothetical protein
VPIEFAIEDLCNLILQLALDLNRRQQRLDASQDGVQMSELKLGNVKDRVNSTHVSGKFNGEGSGTGLADNFIRTVELLGELLLQPGQSESFGIDVDFVPNRDFGINDSLFIHRTLIVLLSSSHLVSEFLVKRVEVRDEISGPSGGEIALGMDGDRWVVAFVGEEGGNAHSVIWGGVVSEFSEGKERTPVVRHVVAVHPNVLFQSLVDTLGLSVSGRMVAGSEVETHIQHFSQGSGEMVNKLGAPVEGDMTRNSVLGEDVKDE